MGPCSNFHLSPRPPGRPPLGPPIGALAALLALACSGGGAGKGSSKADAAGVTSAGDTGEVGETAPDVPTPSDSGGTGGVDTPGATPDPGAGGSDAGTLQSPQPTDDHLPSTPPSGDACGPGTTSCQDQSCCPLGTVCVANPGDALGCGTDFCCGSCTSLNACGGGCCPPGQACIGGGGGACGADFCCGFEADPPCPPAVAAACPPGTTCLFNHSARACPPDDFACYHPTGVIACPGEVGCDGGVDFCPAGTKCTGMTGGVCPAGSRGGGNFCCQPDPPADDTCCCDFGEDQYWHCVHGKSGSPTELCWLPWPECCSQKWTLCE